MTGSDDSDSDVTADTEPNNLSTISSKNNTSPASLNTDVKYNSVYHNSGRVQNTNSTNAALFSLVSVAWFLFREILTQYGHGIEETGNLDVQTRQTQAICLNILKTCFKPCSHVQTPNFGLLSFNLTHQSFNIVPMVGGTLTSRIGLEPI